MLQKQNKMTKLSGFCVKKNLNNAWIDENNLTMAKRNHILCPGDSAKELVRSTW